MKINLLNYNTPYSSGKSEVKQDPQAFKERYSAGVCDKKNSTRGYNVNFSGNPTQKASEVAAKSLGDKILTSKTFGNILEYAEGHPVSCNALFSLVIAGMLRPATILSLPGKGENDKKKKLDAAAHAVASGGIGFLFATIVMSPFDSAMKKLKKDPSKYLGKKAQEYLGDLKAKGLTKTKKFRNVEKLIKMGPDILIGIPRSLITIALIPPILKYVFGIDPKKKDQKAETEMKAQQSENTTNNTQYTKVSLNNPAFNAIKGGER